MNQRDVLRKAMFCGSLIELIDKTQGYTILPEGMPFDRESERELLAFIKQEVKMRGVEVSPTARSVRLYTAPLFGKTGLKVFGVEPFLEKIDRLTQKIACVLEEDFVVGQVFGRISKNALPHNHGRHVDEKPAYFTLIYPFGSSGPQLYVPDSTGQMQTINTPAHRATLLSGRSRQETVGIPATPHAAHNRKFKERTILGVVYYGKK